MATKNETTATALAVIENFSLPVLSDGIGAAMAEEMEGLQLSFPRVKIPSGGGWPLRFRATTRRTRTQRRRS